MSYILTSIYYNYRFWSNSGAIALAPDSGHSAPPRWPPGGSCTGRYGLEASWDDRNRAFNKSVLMVKMSSQLLKVQFCWFLGHVFKTSNKKWEKQWKWILRQKGVWQYFANLVLDGLALRLRIGFLLSLKVMELKFNKSLKIHIIGQYEPKFRIWTSIL